MDYNKIEDMKELFLDDLNNEAFPGGNASL